MSKTKQSVSVDVLIWTQRAWNKAADNPRLRGMKKWSALDVGFQEYLLQKTKGCTSEEEVRAALEDK